MGDVLDIGEVRARTGLPVSALHFYERRGLIETAGRAGLRRQYPDGTIDRLALIVLCQKAGFRLDEIAELLATAGDAGWKDIARAKLEGIRSQIRDLRSVERGLTHALNCPSENVLRCDHFRAELTRVIPVADRRKGSGPSS